MYTMAEARDFKFGIQLRFAKAHHKITRIRKGGHGPGLGEFPKIWGFPSNISATSRVSDLKFGMQLEFAKAHHKITRRRKAGHVPGTWASGAPQNLGVPLQYLRNG